MMDKFNGFIGDDAVEPSLLEVVENARGCYRAAIDRANKEAEKQELAYLKMQVEEHQKLMSWLAEWLPSELVPYLDLSMFSHDKAKRWYYTDDQSGSAIRILIPACFPLEFHVIYKDDPGYQLAKSGKHGEAFSVPHHALMDMDDDGDPFINYRWAYQPNYEVFDVALGAAKEMYEQHWQKLQDQWFSMQTETKVDTEIPDEPEPLTGIDAMVAALTSIAESLKFMQM